MVFNNVFFFLVLACHFDVFICTELFSSLAVQPVWQAGEPIALNVDYDVPAFGPDDVRVNLQPLADIEDGVAARGIHSHSSPSFLTTKVLPVDADRIKRGWYLTQPLRSPPQATVNVIMHEDVQNMKDASKYNGMLDQTIALQQAFRKGLADMSNRHA